MEENDKNFLIGIATFYFRLNDKEKTDFMADVIELMIKYVKVEMADFEEKLKDFDVKFLRMVERYYLGLTEEKKIQFMGVFYTFKVENDEEGKNLCRK